MGNNAGSGAFWIVLLLVVITSGAGFLFKDNDVKNQQIEVAAKVEEQLALENHTLAESEQALKDKVAQLNDDIAQKQAIIDDLNQKLATADDTNSTLTRDLESTINKNSELIHQLAAKDVELSEARAQRNQAVIDQEVLKSRLADANNLAAPAKEQVSQVNQTLLQRDSENQINEVDPQTAELEKIIPDTAFHGKENMAFPLLTVVGTTLFGIASLVSYRRGRGTSSRVTQKQNNLTRQVYRADANNEIILVKMTRAEAHRYARDRRN